jgi:DNA anti-recombination protein RmuC
LKESNKEILKLKRRLKDKQELGEEREQFGESRSTEYVKSFQEKIKKMEEEKDGFFAPKVL